MKKDINIQLIDKNIEITVSNEVYFITEIYKYTKNRNKLPYLGFSLNINKFLNDVLKNILVNQ